MLKNQTSAIWPRTRGRVQLLQAGKVGWGAVNGFASLIWHLSGSLHIEIIQSINSVSNESNSFDYFAHCI